MEIQQKGQTPKDLDQRSKMEEIISKMEHGKVRMQYNRKGDEKVLGGLGLGEFEKAFY